MVKKIVVDTNVAISANGKNTHASIRCQLACVELLQDCGNLPIAIDQMGLIMEEYAKYLSYSGQPGVGDIFFKYLHDNQFNELKISRVKITPVTDSCRGFDELPRNTLDPSDRKFLAAAIVAKAIIINATDSDWSEQHQLLKTLDVEMNQLCPEHSLK